MDCVGSQMCQHHIAILHKPFYLKSNARILLASRCSSLAPFPFLGPGATLRRLWVNGNAMFSEAFIEEK